MNQVIEFTVSKSSSIFTALLFSVFFLPMLGNENINVNVSMFEDSCLEIIKTKKISEAEEKKFSSRAFLLVFKMFACFTQD